MARDKDKSKIDDETLGLKVNPESDADPTLIHEMSLELNKVIPAVMENNPDVDLIHLADTNHLESWSTFKYLSSNRALQAMAESGITHIFLEIPQVFDESANQYLAGEISKAEFRESFKDLESGADAFKEARRQMQGLAQKHGVELDKFRNIEGDVMQAVEIKRCAAKYGIEAHFSDPQNGLNVISKLKQEELARDALADDDPSNDARARSILLDPDIAALAGRTDDQDLAAYVKSTLHGEKGLIFYGSIHGSRDGDFEEHMSEMKTFRIDVHNSPQNIGLYREILEETNNAYGFDFGSDKPELVVVRNTRGMDTVYTTNKTPESLIQDLADKASSFKPHLPESKTPDHQDPDQALEALESAPDAGIKPPQV